MIRVRVRVRVRVNENEVCNRSAIGELHEDDKACDGLDLDDATEL